MDTAPPTDAGGAVTSTPPAGSTAAITAAAIADTTIETARAGADAAPGPATPATLTVPAAADAAASTQAVVGAETETAETVTEPPESPVRALPPVSFRAYFKAYLGDNGHAVLQPIAGSMSDPRYTGPLQTAMYNADALTDDIIDILVELPALQVLKDTYEHEHPESVTAAATSGLSPETSVRDDRPASAALCNVEEVPHDVLTEGQQTQAERDAYDAAVDAAEAANAAAADALLEQMDAAARADTVNRQLGDGHAALSELRATGRVRDPGHPEASAAAAAAAAPGRASYADTRDEPGPEYRDYDRMTLMMAKSSKVALPAISTNMLGMIGGAVGDIMFDEATGHKEDDSSPTLDISPTKKLPPIDQIANRTEVRQYFREKGIVALFQDMAELMVLDKETSPYDIMLDRLDDVKPSDRLGPREQPSSPAVAAVVAVAEA